MIMVGYREYLDCQRGPLHLSVSALSRKSRRPCDDNDFPSRYVSFFPAYPPALDEKATWFGLALDPSQHDVFTVIKAKLPLPRVQPGYI